jgi:hypothetical protein
MKRTGQEEIVKSNSLPRMIGLGQAPAGSDGADQTTVLNQLKCPFGQVPNLEYVTRTTQLPMSDTDLSQGLGEQVNLLDTNPQGWDDTDTSFIVSNILQTDMLLTGIGVHAFGEPETFMAIGNSIAAPATTSDTPVSADAYATADTGVNKALMGLSGNETMSPAILEWGHAAWMGLWHLTNAYELQFILHQRFYLLNELLADFAYYGPYADGIGSGTNEVDVQEYARQTNNRYRDKNSTSVFAPVNFRREGSVTGANGSPVPTGSAAAAGDPLAAQSLWHPTRDFDLAEAMQGGLRNQGGAGCCSPFKRFSRPVLLEAGLPIGLRLQAKDPYHREQMLRYFSISEGQGGTSAVVQFDVNASGLTVAGTANTSVAPELTLDQGANAYASNQLHTFRVLYKGGVIKLAAILKGFEVWGAWKRVAVGMGIPVISKETIGARNGMALGA